MTNREFYNAVMNAETISDEIRDHAAALLEKMDAKNASRSSKPTKAQKENEELLPIVREALAGKTEPTTASMLHEMLPDFSISKCTALLKTLVSKGELEMAKVKVKGKREQNGYTPISAPTDVAE